MKKLKSAVNNSVVCKDRLLTDLAQKYGTPLYIYDLKRLGVRVAALRSAFESANVRLFFATMANNQLPVLKALARMNVGACVNSIPHLERTREAGFKIGQVQYTTTGITYSDMLKLQHFGVSTNFDSINQLKTWYELGGRQAGIRINAASLAYSNTKDRIGICAGDVKKAIAESREYGCELAGLHIYVGTNFQNPNEMLPTLTAFFELAGCVEELSYVNIGGGIGINYKHEGKGFDISAYGKYIAELGKQLRDKYDRPIDIIFEPGRSLVADCGTFVTSVTDIKRLNGQQYVAVDGSIAIFPRPFHHPDSPHRIRELGIANESSGANDNRSKAVVVGRTTFSRDILGETFFSRDIQVGDRLAFDDAGAYSQSMASAFLGQPDPSVVLLDGGESRLYTGAEGHQ